MKAKVEARRSGGEGNAHVVAGRGAERGDRWEVMASAFVDRVVLQITDDGRESQTRIVLTCSQAAMLATALAGVAASVRKRDED